MATGYVNAAAERTVWDGRDVRAWEFPPTHWMPLPEPPSAIEGEKK
jgi:hypothetical protein